MRRVGALLAGILAVAALTGAFAASGKTAIVVQLTTPTSGATGLGGVVAVGVTASADAGVKSVQLEVDGQLYGSPDTTTVATYQYVIPWDTTTVASGMHTLTAVALDWSGATQISAPVTVGVGSPESVALTSPLPWTFVRGKQAQLAATVVAAAPATVTYAVDGTTVAGAGAAPWSASFDSTTYADGAHTVTATVVDATGQTAVSTAAVTFDNTAPTASILAPAANGTFFGTLPVQAHASDAYGIASVQYLVDGSPSGGALTTPDGGSGYTYSATLDISKLANGAHTFAELATDNAGNTTTTPAVAFTVAAPKPATTLVSPLPWTFATKTTTVTATVTGGAPPLSIQLLVDGTASTLAPTVSGTTATFAWDTSKVPDGGHTLAVRVTDATGLVATTATVNVTVDNTAPTVVVYQPLPPAGGGSVISNGPTTFQVHASDAYGIGSVQYMIDGNPVGPLLTAPDSGQLYLYSLSFDTSTLTPGLHTMTALVTDHAGNTTTSTAVTLKTGSAVQYLPVLNYHGIEGPLDLNPDIYDQTSAEADAQLSYLKTNGYQSVTLQQYMTWLQTGALPAGVTKPVLITIDDGFTDELAWDPLLQKYGFNAVLFVVTGFADNTSPGNDGPAVDMSWAQINQLVATGRWQVAFHAGLYGHADFSDSTTSINLGNNQTQRYPSTCFAFYNCLGNIRTTTVSGTTRTTTTTKETPAQFESQVTTDITTGVAELQQQVPSAVTNVFACPWNACGQWTNFYNDPSGTLQAWLPGFLASNFAVVFMQTDPATYSQASGTVGSLTGFNRHYRFEVHTDTTLTQFAAALTDPGFAHS